MEPAKRCDSFTKIMEPVMSLTSMFGAFSPHVSPGEEAKVETSI